MKKTIFTGVGTAIVTPMNADGSINYDEFGKLIEFQIANGADALVVCGTTGEASTMPDEPARTIPPTASDFPLPLKSSARTPCFR